MHYRALINLDVCVFRTMFVDLVKHPAKKIKKMGRVVIGLSH